MDRPLIASCYADVTELAGKCKKKDCQHEYRDSTCSVREAVKSGAITTARLHDYQQAVAACDKADAQAAKNKKG